MMMVIVMMTVTMTVMMTVVTTLDVKVTVPIEPTVRIAPQAETGESSNHLCQMGKLHKH